MTAHEGFGYYGLAYGIQFLAPMGMSTEEEVRAKDMADLIQKVRDLAVKVLFVESISNEKVIKQIASEGKAEIGEVLYSDSLSEPEEGVASYLAMLAHNSLHIFKSLMCAHPSSESVDLQGLFANV